MLCVFTRRKSAKQRRPRKVWAAAVLFLLCTLVLFTQNACKTNSDRAIPERRQQNVAETDTSLTSDSSALALASDDTGQSFRSDTSRLVQAKSLLVEAKSLSATSEDTLACQPRAVTGVDTLVLSMQTPHGGDMGVTSPDNTFSWLVRDGENIGNVLDASMDFRLLTRLRLPVEEASALPAVYGVDKPKRLFREAGMYTFHLSEELETDHGTSVAECEVAYRAN
jgi:hypothetical protein